MSVLMSGSSDVLRTPSGTLNTHYHGHGRNFCDDAGESIKAQYRMMLANRSSFEFVPAINPRTGREYTIDEQRDEQELFPAGPLRDIMQQAVQERISQREARIAIERALTQDQIIITRFIQEEQNRLWRVEQDATAKKVMLELQASPSTNIHGYSAAGLESLAHMVQYMLSMALPGDHDNFLAALIARDDAEVKADKQADRERRRERRGKATCGHCGQHGTLLKCGGCHSNHSNSPARYCNQDCQRAAWKGGHKDACRKKKPLVRPETFGGRFPKGGYKNLES
jgi:hypothetical protein